MTMVMGLAVSVAMAVLVMTATPLKLPTPFSNILTMGWEGWGHVLVPFVLLPLYEARA